MDNYALYLRKSRADLDAESRGELETLARHKKTLMELAKKLKLPVSAIYREVVSGETIAARPMMQKLLQEVADGLWHGVLVMEIERLARGDGIDQQIVLNTFKAGGTKIITPIKTYDPNDEFDEEYFEFGLFMSRREYKTINRRIQRGRIASVKEGKAIISTPPYGYNKVKIPNDKGYTLVPNEEADVVKLIFQLYNGGAGMTKVATELDKLKIKPRHRETWSKSTINDILKNPVYMGKIRWSYHKQQKTIVDGVLKKRRILNDQCYYVDGLHEAIITDEEFDRAQENRKHNTHHSTKKDLSLKNPLASIVFCKKCGAAMTRIGSSNKTPYDTLKCPNKNCNNISAPLELIEENLIHYLSLWLDSYQIKIEQFNNPTLQTHNTIRHKSIDKLSYQIKQIKKQISQTYDLLETGVYTVEIFLQRREELEQRKKDCYEAKLLLQNELEANQNKLGFDMEAISCYKTLLGEYYSVKDVELRNKILKKIVVKVEYLKTHPNTKGNQSKPNFELYITPYFPKELSP